MLIIEEIRAFSDNFIWLLHKQNKAWLVDPGEAEPVLEALKIKNLDLQGILLTHHHFDHVGGVDKLLEAYPKTFVYGPKGCHPKCQAVDQQKQINILNHEAEILLVPGHTLDHIAYYFQEDSVLFCGDTLFAGGCGRVFEGSMEMMFQSLKKLSVLPSNTQIYCAHEYTQSNLKFAVAVEPDNTELINRLNETKTLRQHDQSTVPSTLKVELETNPFLRVDSSKIQQQLKTQDKWQGNQDWQVFKALREWKDCY